MTAGPRPAVPEQVRVSPEAAEAAAQVAAQRGLPVPPEPAPVETRGNGDPDA